MAARDDLRAIAESYADDIAAADDIAREFLGAPDALPLPSTIINGLINTDTDALRAQINQLVTAKDYYGEINTGNLSFVDLMNEWAGDGADGFEHRWTALSGYVQGNPSGKGDMSVVGRIDKHAEVTGTLLDGIEAAQRQCGQYIQEKLKGLRTMWDDTTSLITGEGGGLIAGAGVGAAAGAPFALVGAIPGAVVGAFVGAIAGGVIAAKNNNTAWTVENERIKGGITGIASLDDTFELDTAAITELAYDPGPSSPTEMFEPWRIE